MKKGILMNNLFSAKSLANLIILIITIRAITKDYCAHIKVVTESNNFQLKTNLEH